MQRFWETVIEPVIEVLRPESIVEVGSDAGGNTKNLLEFCRRSGATLHVVDPLPKYDVDEWREHYRERLVFHKDLSLDALPRIDGFDLVLIDGDHNWYTVFNELKAIEKRCENLSIPFPLVMLHDIGWPYGRRDLYYDPATIPAEHRKPYEKKGLRPGLVGLAEKGGLNPHLCNATHENEPRGGVLTAIEDFLKQTEHDLDLLKVPRPQRTRAYRAGGSQGAEWGACEISGDLRAAGTRRPVRRASRARPYGDTDRPPGVPCGPAKAQGSARKRDTRAKGSDAGKRCSDLRTPPSTGQRVREKQEDRSSATATIQSQALDPEQGPADSDPQQGAGAENPERGEAQRVARQEGPPDSRAD